MDIRQRTQDYPFVPPLPDPRLGFPVRVKGRTLAFSMWPVERSTRRFGLTDYLFAKNPWPIIADAVAERAPASARAQASAFVEQARSFYEAAQPRTLAATPLLFYYAFMNLAKAIVLADGATRTMDGARHGLWDRPPAAGRSEIGGARVTVMDTGHDPNIFPMLGRALGLAVPGSGIDFAVTDLLPQVVVGHRIWREAGGRERFVALEKISFFQDVTEGPGNLWLRLEVNAGDLSRYRISKGTFLSEGRLVSRFRAVRPEEVDVLVFEQTVPVHYTHRATDELQNAVDGVRDLFWRSATSIPPYRHYYVHLTPAAASASRLPQLLSLYMLFFYFGSVTRYRPHVFDELVKSAYGPFIREFIESQPDQLLYLLASEVRRREVAKPALI